MGLLGWTQRAVELAGALPGVRQLGERVYERRFAANRDDNLFRGVYRTFAEAAASAPPTRPTGYDNPDSAAMYRSRLDHVAPGHYPALFWLARCFADGARRVFDLGGHIGVLYYAFERYLRYPADLAWWVYDVPSVTRAGREWAAKHEPSGRLRFTDALDANGSDVLFASGSTQYLEHTLADLLARTHDKPRFVLANFVPTHPRETYFTLQSIGTAFCAYRIEHDSAFVAEISAQGYRLVDRWRNAEKRCWIPFDREHSLDWYEGFLFERV